MLADQRTPDQEVLDALLRVPDTGFAIHDGPSRIGRLLAEHAEHRAVLADRPPERLRHLRNAERQLASARTAHDEAAWRLDNARQELAELGGLSQLRRHGRQQKASLLQRIDRFEADLVKSHDKVTGCEANLDTVRGEFAHEMAWEVVHGWRADRHRAIEAELADLSGISPEADTPQVSRLGRSRPDSLLHLGRDRRAGRSALWEEHFPEPAAPPLPGRDAGHGLDIGP